MDLLPTGSDELVYIQTDKVNLTIKGPAAHPSFQGIEYRLAYNFPLCGSSKLPAHLTYSVLLTPHRLMLCRCRKGLTGRSPVRIHSCNGHPGRRG